MKPLHWALGMWKAFEKNYQTKSFSKKNLLEETILLLQDGRRHNYKNNVDIYLKLIAYLESIEITISDEYQSIQLSLGLPRSV